MADHEHNFQELELYSTLYVHMCVICGEPGPIEEWVYPEEESMKPEMMLYTQEMYNAEMKYAISLFPLTMRPMIRLIVWHAGRNDTFPVEIEKRELVVG